LKLAILSRMSPYPPPPGPPGYLPLRVLSGLRARWLAQEVGLEGAAVEAGFLARDLLFALAGPGSEVVLCLEHDLYDQLQLLAELAPRADRLTVTLAQADDHLSTREPGSLAALLARRQPVSDTAFAAGTALWAAFRATTPEVLAAHLGLVPPELSRMAPAIARLLGGAAAGRRRPDGSATSPSSAAPTPWHARPSR
jgi:hypothetical protein